MMVKRLEATKNALFHDLTSQPHGLRVCNPHILNSTIPVLILSLHQRFHRLLAMWCGGLGNPPGCAQSLVGNAASNTFMMSSARPNECNILIFSSTMAPDAPMFMCNLHELKSMGGGRIALRKWGFSHHFCAQRVRGYGQKSRTTRAATTIEPHEHDDFRAHHTTAQRPPRRMEYANESACPSPL